MNEKVKYTKKNEIVQTKTKRVVPPCRGEWQTEQNELEEPIAIALITRYR